MFPDNVLPCKQENGCFDQTILCWKNLCEIKKIKSGNDHSVERSFPNSGCFCCWNVNCTAKTSKQMPRWSRKPRQSLSTFQGKRLKPPFKKWIERMEACLAANRWYFERENVKYMTSESEDDKHISLCFRSFLKWNFFSFVGCKIVSFSDSHYTPLPFVINLLTSSLNSMFIFSIANQ